MKIFVCIKQILDPELPPSAFALDQVAKRAVIDKHPLVISPFDENALEIALQLKAKVPGSTITALTYGPATTEEILRKALGLLVDEAVMVQKESDGEQDACAVASVLAAAINKLGPADLVLCGRQAGDWDAGLVGYCLSEELRFPCVSCAAEITAQDGKLLFKTEVDGGFETVESLPGVVATVTNDEHNLIRVAKIRDVMMAHRKKITTFSVVDLGLDGGDLNTLRVHNGLKEIYVPSQSTTCEIIEGEGPEEKVNALVVKMNERKVI